MVLDAANVPGHRPRASDVPLATETRSRGFGAAGLLMSVGRCKRQLTISSPMAAPSATLELPSCAAGPPFRCQRMVSNPAHRQSPVAILVSPVISVTVFPSNANATKSS